MVEEYTLKQLQVIYSRKFNKTGSFFFKFVRTVALSLAYTVYFVKALQCVDNICLLLSFVSFHLLNIM